MSRAGGRWARKMLASGKDPGELKKEAKRLAILRNANTFEVVAREWFEKRKHEWAPSSIKALLGRLEQYILPKLGERAIAENTAPEVLAMLRVIENKGALETAHRVMQITGQIFMYAIATGRAERNPVSGPAWRAESAGRQASLLPYRKCAAGILPKAGRL
jgi:integrase